MDKIIQFQFHPVTHCLIVLTEDGQLYEMSGHPDNLITNITPCEKKIISSRKILTCNICGDESYKKYCSPECTLESFRRRSKIQNDKKLLINNQ